MTNATQHPTDDERTAFSIGKPRFDLLNMRFGRVLVIEYVGVGRWLCQCNCGKQKVISGIGLRRGYAKSCGCYRKEFTRANATHGMTLTRTYRTWAAMRNRCSDPDSKWFKRYGGRGIKVCERWNSFEAFLADMGEVPDGASIDRINNDGNYEPENCRWATRLEQERNKSSNRYFVINGEKRALSEWCEIYGAPYQRVHARLLIGWDIERALTAPVVYRGQKNMRKCCAHEVLSSTPCAQCEAEIEATTC